MEARIPLRETTCCRKNGHVTMCPVLRVYPDGSFSISDDHGGEIRLTREELLAVTRASAAELLEQHE